MGISRALGQWEEIAVHISAIFPPTLEPDAALVKEFRVQMPDFVPLHIRRVYKTPEGSEEQLNFVAAGRWARTPDDPDMEPLRVERPYDFPFRGGVIYLQRPFGTQSLWGWPAPKVWADRGVTDLPIEFDRQLVDWLSQTHRWFTQKTAKEKKREAMGVYKREAELRNKSLAELDAQKKEEFVDGLSSPGMAKDAAWAATRSPNVSVGI